MLLKVATVCSLFPIHVLVQLSLPHKLKTSRNSIPAKPSKALFFFFLVAHSFIITTKKSLTLSLFTKSMYAPSYFPLGHFHTTLDSLFFSQPSLSFFFLKRRRKMKLIFLFKLQLSHWSSSFSSPARCEDAARHHHR